MMFGERPVENAHPGGEAVERIVVHSRVGADGVLRLNVPIGAAAADGEVEVTIEAADPKLPTNAEREEWRQFVLSTAGTGKETWSDPTRESTKSEMPCRDLPARHELIGPNDLMIASIARAHGLTMVTHNTKEFSRVPGLKLEDWQ